MGARKWALGLFSLALFFALPSWALNVQHHRPTTGATGGYKVRTTETLDAGEIAVGFDGNFSDDTYESDLLKPIAPINVDLVDQLATFDFLLNAGITDWLDFNFDLPVHFFHDINFPGFGQNAWDAEVGDMLFELKGRVVNAQENDMGVGLALIPFLTVPTGTRNLYQGARTVTGGLNVALEKIWDGGRVYTNIGGHFRGAEFASPFVPFESISHEMTYGAGVQQRLIPDTGLDGILEFTGATNFQAEIASPAEATMLLRHTCGDAIKFITHGGAGLGLGDGYGSPDWRAFGGFSVVFGGKKDAPPPAEPAAAAPAPKPTPQAKVYKKGERIDLRGKINFKINKADILASAYPVLDDAITKMKKHPEIAKVEIEGHTDSSGAAEYNLNLSQRRADSVKQYFIKKGIASSRLTTKGYGETKPVSSNDTRAGRAENRRIVFRVAEFKE